LLVGVDDFYFLLSLVNFHKLLEIGPISIVLAPPQGMTESVKTNLVKQIIRYNSQNYHNIYLVCSTINLQSKYDCLPKQAVLPLSEESIEEVLEEQKKKNKKRLALIFDDVLGKMCFQNSNLFDYIASSCRHFRLHAFLLAQDLKKLSPIIRDNCKVLFVTQSKEHSLKTCFKLSSNFGSFQEFKEFMGFSCKDYNVVRFDLTGEVRVFNLNEWLSNITKH